MWKSLSREYCWYLGHPRARPTQIVLKRPSNLLRPQMLKTPAIVALLLFTLLAGMTSTSHPAQGIPGPSGGAPTPGVDDSSNIWTPYGPRSARLQLNYYANEVSEFTDFELGHLDLTDWPVSTVGYGSYDTNPDIILSTGQGEFGMFGIDFNMNSSTWASWNCNF